MRGGRLFAQRGAALAVSLIMLVLITLMVIAALNLGTSNFRAVSNTQFREQAIAAANVAIQDRISSDFTGPADANGAIATTYPSVDLNNDGTDDYTVAITPTCVSATVAQLAEPSSIKLPGELSVAATWNTVWDIRAEVTPPTPTGPPSVTVVADPSGAKVVVHAGVRVLLTQSEKNDACP
jgi:type II secretory pathway pseudopilin PulG